MTQHIKPLNQMDNGGLLTIALDALECFFMVADSKADEGVSRGGINALKALESRTSFDEIKERKE